MSNLSVVGVKVRQDSEGRYSLNDLHKAAMAAGKATISQRPGAFLQSATISSFINALDSDATMIASVKTIKGGNNQGTYATELVAIRYAGWIDPTFEIKVYSTFQAVAKGEIQKAIDIATRKTIKDEYLPMTNALKESRLLEGKEVKHFHFSNENNMIYRILLGQTAKEYKELNGTDSVRDSLTLVEKQALLSLQRANTTMLELGYDYDKRKNELGKLYQRIWLYKLTQEHLTLEA